MLKKIALLFVCLPVVSLNAMGCKVQEEDFTEELLLATTHFIEQPGVELLVKRLLSNGADVTSRDKKGWTALHKSTAAGNYKVVKLLLDHGCPVDIRTGYPMKTTSVSLAITNDRTDILKLLLERGANANDQDGVGMRPAHCAILHRRVEMLKLLVAAGADLSIPLALGQLPTIQFAMEKGDTEKGDNGYVPLAMLTYLLDQGAPFPGGYEALAKIIEKNQPERAELLRKYKPRVCCAVCNSSPQELKVCGGCKRVRYCGTDCQRRNWAAHKAFCKPVEPAAQSAVKLEECCVCLNPLAKNVTRVGKNCLHTIHVECRAVFIKSALKEKTCPLCRAVL